MNISIDQQMLDVLIGAVDVIIEQHIDDEDARAFTDQLHELDTMLRRVRATTIDTTQEDN